MAFRYAPSTNLPPGTGRFQTTAWTVVLNAKDRAADDYRRSLEYLIKTYWKPVYLFVRSRGRNHDQAKDLTQEFFAVFMEKHFLDKVDREKGKFRTFLLTAVTRFLLNAHARAKTIKRGGGLKPLRSLEALKDEDIGSGWEPSETETAEDAFNRNWARALLEQVFQRLREVCRAEGKEIYYDVLRLQFFESGPDGRKLSYRDLANRLGLTETDVTNYLHRAKKIYRDVLREEIRSYVDSEEAVDDEIRELWRSLSA